MHKTHIHLHIQARKLSINILIAYIWTVQLQFVHYVLRFMLQWPPSNNINFQKVQALTAAKTHKSQLGVTFYLNSR